MLLQTITFAAYLTRDHPPGNPGRYHDALKFTKALKGTQLNGWAWVPVREVLRRLENTNLDDAIDWLGQKVADHVGNNFPGIELVLIPVPNKAAVRGTNVTPRTALLAEAIQRHIGQTGIVADVLRWRRALLPAHRGGPRDFPTLYDALLMVEDDLPRNRVVALVDDMVTSGTHLQAASTEIARKTGSDLRPDLAFCGARRVDACPPDSFTVEEFELEDVAVP